MYEINEKEQFGLIKEGNIQAFESVFKSLYQPLCSYACALLKDPDESEEAVQQTFINIWEKKSQIEMTSSIKSYLYRSVKNECLNKIKHIKVRRMYQTEVEYTGEQSVDSSNELLISKELETGIVSAIGGLPEQCRIIFNMSRTDGKKYQEIADELGLSIKTVENQIGKALRILRGKLVDFLPSFILFITLLIRERFGK